MAELEEPGWPNLSTPGMPPPGQTFMRAFAVGAQINQRKQQMENQLIKLQQSMALQEQKHELDMDKFDWQQKYQTAQLGRAYDSMQMRDYLQNKQQEFTAQQNEIKGARKDAIYDNAGQLGDELAAVTQKYPVGSQAAQNEFNYVLTKHASTLATPEGQRVLKTFQSEHTAAANESHRYAAELRQNFDSTLQMVGKGSIGREDFLQPEKVWQTDKQGNKFLAKIAEPVPGGAPNQVNWMVLGKKEVDDLAAAGKGANIQYSTLPKQAYSQLRKMHDRMLEIGGNDLSQKPSITSSPRAERARQALNDPEATEAEKAAAAKILSANQ